jgi:DNA-directed RNA polymerase specialized sigma24 family protein
MVRDINNKFAGKTIAAAIRNLDAKGLKRAQIAKRLGIRYQMVRNTLVRGIGEAA